MKATLVVWRIILIKATAENAVVISTEMKFWLLLDFRFLPFPDPLFPEKTEFDYAKHLASRSAFCLAKEAMPVPKGCDQGPGQLTAFNALACFSVQRRPYPQIQRFYRDEWSREIWSSQTLSLRRRSHQRCSMDAHTRVFGKTQGTYSSLFSK